jgi:hypothetical protein
VLVSVCRHGEWMHIDEIARKWLWGIEMCTSEPAVYSEQAVGVG